MWKDKLQNVYSSYEDFKNWDDIYGLTKALGYSNSKKLWNDNPTIKGSTNPRDYGIVKKSNNNKHISVEDFLNIFKEKYPYIYPDLTNKEIEKYLNLSYIKNEPLEVKMDLFSDYITSQGLGDVQENNIKKSSLKKLNEYIGKRVKFIIESKDYGMVKIKKDNNYKTIFKGEEYPLLKGYSDYYIDTPGMTYQLGDMKAEPNIFDLSQIKISK